jgi:hypothetical protein
MTPARVPRMRDFVPEMRSLSGRGPRRLRRRGKREHGRRWTVDQVQEDERTAAAAEEAELLARLRAGDERAFETLVDGYYGTTIA